MAMIPAGYEKNKKFQFNDDYDDFDDDYEDEDFYFIGSDNKSTGFSFKNNPTPTRESSENLIKSNFKIQSQFNDDAYDEADYARNDLQHAISHKNLQLVKDLFDRHNFDVNCELESNWIPLMYSVSCGNYEITEYLIDKGANIFYNDDTFSIILSACGCIDLNARQSDLVKIVKLLVKKGVDVNSYDNLYQTPLMYASRANNLLLIDFLVTSGADINSQDEYDWTPLTHASYKGNLKCVQMLLKLGADPSIYTYDYMYPFDIAQINGFSEIKNLIKRFIRVKKYENAEDGGSDQNLLTIKYDDDGFESLDDCDDDLSIKKRSSELETFLDNLRLRDLIPLFKYNDITMNKLVNFTESDLKKINVSDSIARELIMKEIQKFHLRNWQSSCLVPIRQNFNINSNEVIAIYSNLSRITDFMSTNVKYITAVSMMKDCDLFTDKYMCNKIISEFKKTFKNTKALVQNLEKFSELTEKYMAETEPVPLDYIKKFESKNKPNDFLRYTLFSVLGGVCIAVVLYEIKKQLF